MEYNNEDPKWFVVYTRPKSERKVADSATDMGIESYLPMHKIVRQWSDRKIKLQVPLFPNYVFVRVNERRRAYLFSIKELVRFVSIERKPVIVRDNEILAIKRILNQEVDISVEKHFPQGTKVKIHHGQFAGLEGVVTRQHNQTRLVIRIEKLMKAFSSTIPANLVYSVSNREVLSSG